MASFMSRLFGVFGPRQNAPQDRQAAPLDADIAEIIARLSPPADRRNSAAWDDYWRRQLSTGFGLMFDMMFHDRELAALMRKEGLRRTLVVGNGVSVEPRALSAAGFDVLALDLSPLALEIAQQIELGDEQLASLIGENGRQPGGTVTFVAGDLFDPAVGTGPFDVIIERRTAQDYPDDERDALLSALADRLTPRGILVSHCHDGAWRPPREPRHATAEWFRAHGWNILRKAEDRRSSGRSAWLVSSTG
jgi:SAM-dependent methyltransferase